MACKPGDRLGKWELATAKKLVSEFRRRFQIFEHYEFDDLMQDCLVTWLTVRQKVIHDPGDPPVGYMAQVLRNKLTDWVRERGPLTHRVDGTCQ